MGRRFSIGHVDQEHVMSLVDKEGDGATHSKFLVIGMWAEDGNASHGTGKDTLH